jgi:hypothetical protein
MPSSRSLHVQCAINHLPDSPQLEGLRPPLKAVGFGRRLEPGPSLVSQGRRESADRGCTDGDGIEIYRDLGCSTGCRVSQGQSPQSLCRYLCRYCAGTALVLF